MLRETESRCREARRNVAKQTVDRFAPKIEKVFEKKDYYEQRSYGTLGYGTLAASVAINECIIHL